LEGGESGETIARVIIDFGRHAPIDRDGFIELLRRDDPVIEVVLHDRTSIALSPHLLQPDEAEVVEARVGELLAELGSIVMAAVVAARPGSGVV
jgi:hypothetical protein